MSTLRLEWGNERKTAWHERTKFRVGLLSGRVYFEVTKLNEEKRDSSNVAAGLRSFRPRTIALNRRATKPPGGARDLNIFAGDPVAEAWRTWGGRPRSPRIV